MSVWTEMFYFTGKSFFSEKSFSYRPKLHLSDDEVIVNFKSSLLKEKCLIDSRIALLLQYDCKKVKYLSN